MSQMPRRSNINGHLTLCTYTTKNDCMTAVEAVLHPGWDNVDLCDLLLLYIPAAGTPECKWMDRWLGNLNVSVR